MSNLGDYAKTIQGLSDSDKAALETVGSFVGVLADISGALGLATMIVGVVSSLISTDGMPWGRWRRKLLSSAPNWTGSSSRPESMRC
jgi:hypothetical protein